MSKAETYTVMVAPFRVISGEKVRPYGTFKSVMTPELKDDLDKGYIHKGIVTEESTIKLLSTKKRSSKKSRR